MYKVNSSCIPKTKSQPVQNCKESFHISHFLQHKRYGSFPIIEEHERYESFPMIEEHERYESFPMIKEHERYGSSPAIMHSLRFYF